MVVEAEGSGSHCECSYEAERGEITSQITVCLIQPGVPPSSLDDLLIYEVDLVSSVDLS